MSAHVAHAVLPVAIGLVALAAVCRAALSRPELDRGTRSWMGQHLDPLCSWGSAAVILYVAAVSASGGLAAVPVVLALVLAFAATALRSSGSRDAQDAREDAAHDAAPAPAWPEAPPPPVPSPAAGGPLWGRPEPPGRTRSWG